MGNRNWVLLVIVAIVMLIGASPTLYFMGGMMYEIATTKRPNWDVVVAKGSDCQLRDHQALSNRHGVIAVLREANCPGDFAQGTAYNVVFVHAVDESNTRDNIALQYTPGFEGYNESPLPIIVWTTPNSLEITAPGVVDLT